MPNAENDNGPRMTNGPARWLIENRELLPRSGRALDVACGHGRHALWLAEQGYEVFAVDRAAAAVEAVNAAGRERGLAIAASVRDLEADDRGLAVAPFDIVVVVHYLHRPLFPRLIDAVAPGGVLVYETFTREQASRGRPANPAFLLEPGELVRLVAPLRVLIEREGDFDGRFVASVVAKKPRV